MTENFNQLTPGQTERIGLMVEEMGETLQVIGKIIRHGYQSRNPFKPEKDNRFLLESEVGDTQAALKQMYTAGDLNPRNVRQHRDDKLNKPNRYLHHQDDVSLDGKMKIVVAGSRSYNNYAEFSDTLEKYLKMIGAKDSNFVIISGDAAHGPDAMAIRWCYENKVPCDKMPANWDEFGKSAGYIRNAEMGKVLTHLLAFWDKKSRGTLHMIENASSKPDTNVFVVFVKPDQES